MDHIDDSLICHTVSTEVDLLKTLHYLRYPRAGNLPKGTTDVCDGRGVIRSGLTVDNIWTEPNQIAINS